MIKHLLHKHEDPGSEPQHPHKSWTSLRAWVTQHKWTLGPGGGASLWSINLAETETFGFSEGTVSKTKVELNRGRHQPLASTPAPAHTDTSFWLLMTSSIQPSRHCAYGHASLLWVEFWGLTAHNTGSVRQGTDRQTDTHYTAGAPLPRCVDMEVTLGQRGIPQGVGNTLSSNKPNPKP